MKSRLSLLLVGVFCASFFSSCKKESIALLVQQVESNTVYGLYDVLFADDSVGYACGGDKWTMGMMVRTTDGGKTWSQPDSLFGGCAYTVYSFSAANVLIGGNSSYLSVSNDSFTSFSTSLSNYRAINDISFITPQRGVKVGGEDYVNGYIGFTTDGGNNWQITDIPNGMNAVCYADSNTVFASGYGVIYRSVNGGATFSPLDVWGDYFVSSSFPTPSTGYFAGYEKMILKTTDAGNSFTEIMGGNAPFSDREHFRVIKFWDENNGYVAGDAGVMYSTINGGDSWQVVQPFTEVNLRGMHLFSATSGIVVGDGGKVFLFKTQ